MDNPSLTLFGTAECISGSFSSEVNLDFIARPDVTSGQNQNFCPMKKVMSRRSAFKTTAATITTGAAVFQLGDFTSYGAVERKGNVNHSVCRWCYDKIPLDQLCKASKEMGISSIDLTGPKEWPTMQQYGLT